MHLKFLMVSHDESSTQCFYFEFNSDFVSPIDSTAVKKLRDAGAIVMGTANMDEMGMGSFGLYGYKGKAVKNPIDTNHFAGGSSAGSAVVVKCY